MSRSRIFSAVLVLVLACAVAVDANSCGTITCGGVGAACASNSTNTVYCTGSTRCVAGVCAAGKANGAGCVTSGDCASYQCNSVTLLCTDRITVPGAACSSNSQCLFSNSTATLASCQNGVCYGIPNGGVCDVVGSTTECSGAYFCNADHVCTKKVAPGQTCAATDVCTDLSFCSSGQCQVFGSVDEQSTCANTNQCGDNEYCAGNGLCAPAVSVTRNACDLGSDCQASSCVCDPNVGYQKCTAPYSNPAGYKAHASDYAKCIASSNCADPLCYESACRSQYCAYKTVVVGALRTYNPQIIPQCQVDDVEGSEQTALNPYCNSANNVGANIAVLAAIIVALVACF